MFITFEGIEGSGKSSVLGKAAEELRSRGFEVVETLEPGGSRLGTELRRILLDMASRDLTGQSELFLYLADRAQHMNDVIRPALDAGKLVLSDRFADSTIVYQGYGRGLDPKLLRTFNDVAIGGLWPDLTLLFDLPVEVGLKRALKRNVDQGKCDEEGRFEAESIAFHEKVREGYLTWASVNQERFRIIDASGPLEEVTRFAIQRVLAKTGEKAHAR